MGTLDRIFELKLTFRQARQSGSSAPLNPAR